MRQLLHILAPVSLALWILLLVALGRSTRSRRRLADVLLALAILFAWRGILAYDFGRDLDTFGFLLASFLPVVITIIIFRRWAKRNHLGETPRCPACDYNLTGNVSGICPECGTPVATHP